MTKYYILTFLISFIVSFLLTPLFRKIAFKFDIVDIPVTPVKSHKGIMPYLGGCAIFLGFIISLTVLRFTTSFPTGTLHSLRGMFIGGGIIFLLGLIDDIKTLDYRFKLIIEFIVGIFLIIYGISIGIDLPDFVRYLLTLFWIVGITNAFNIIDVMDGLSSLVCIISSLAFFFITLPEETFYVNFASLALAGSVLGFLIYNFPPAKIFMGDAGSLFIGFILASISLGGKYTGNHVLGIFVPLIVLFIPMFDVAVVVFFRFKKKRSIFLGSRDHFALRMLEMGYTEREILLRVGVTELLLSVLACLITRVSFSYAVILYAFVILFAFLVGIWLDMVEIE